MTAASNTPEVLSVLDRPNSYIGKAVPRPNLERLMQGRGLYVSDLVLPRMVHVAFVRSPYAHARIVGIDRDAARAQPGVVAEEAGAGLAAAGVQEAPGVSAAERPSGAAAWPSLPPFVAQPRLALPGRAMGCSSVAWPTGQSWQAAQFSSLSCALGPGEIQKRCRGGNAGETVNKH